jgi:hypothetical protein
MSNILRGQPQVSIQSGGEGKEGEEKEGEYRGGKEKEAFPKEIYDYSTAT